MAWRSKMLLLALTLTAFLLLLVDLCVGDMELSVAQVWGALVGSGDDPVAREVVIRLRLVRSLVAVVAGAALTVAGVLMQTIFRNPLAEPYLLGVSAGAGLGVSLLLLGSSIFGAALSGFWLSFGIAGAAWCGAMAVMMLMMVLSQKIKDIMVILVLGMMLGSAISAVVMVLQYLGTESALKAFVLWTMGSLGDVTSLQLALMAAAVVVGLTIASLHIKPLNMLLLGEYYARTMGLRVASTRGWIFLATTLLAGSVTAFCGPIGFVGLAVPHVARMVFSTADHRTLIPASIVIGVNIMLLCDIVAKSLLLPINAITALAAIPIVVVVVLRNRAIGE
ncbi:MAG: iron ABC transporter permease [Rikenellaceae bacterium]